MKAFGPLFLFLICFQLAQAQAPELPNLRIETLKGNNIIHWHSSYSNIKRLNIQRKGTGQAQWVTLGIINRPKKGTKQFTDDEATIGELKYRLHIVFDGDVDWYSNTYTVNLTTDVIAQSGNKTVSSGSSDVKEYIHSGTRSNTKNDEPEKYYTDFYYEPSTQVYTNPYTGHVNITLGDARQKMYSLKFFDPEKNEVLNISRVKNTNIILDKHNFQASGTYFFQLYNGEDLVETGYVTIY